MATSAACTQLGDSVMAAQVYDPIPSVDVQTHWAASLTALASAASDCVSGVDNVDPSLLTQSATELGEGSTEMSAASDAIDAL